MSYILFTNQAAENEKHQTRVSLLLELVSDAYLTANRTRGPVVFHAGYYTTRPQDPDEGWTQSSYKYFSDLQLKATS